MLVRSAVRFVWIGMLLLTGSRVATAAPPYQSALITRMRMVHCMEPPRHGSVMADILVGSAPPTAMGAAECPEYEIEAAKVFYRIRPRKDVLLPVGEEIRFRIHKRDLLVLTDDADKELVFSVVEMTLRSKREPVQGPERVSNAKPRKCLTIEGEIVECGESN